MRWATALGRWSFSRPELAEAQKAEGEEIYKEADLTGENLRTETSFASRRVSHLKYGQGSVVSEDENTITVNFDDYGEKELLKAFSMLEELWGNQNENRT